MEERVSEIAAHFRAPEGVRRVTRLGSGHIHDTFCVEQGEHDRALRRVVQRINTAVFPDPNALMANIERVTRHLVEKLRRRGVPDVERRSLQVIPTTEGAPLYIDSVGDAWRSYAFIEHARGFDLPETPDQAYRAARAFGQFVADLADMDPATLTETIPRFHDLPARIDALGTAAREDAHARATEIGAELERVREDDERLHTELAHRDFASAPRRVVHNDSKFNNVLFDDRDDEALCVVDLDTVMEGTVLCDFGDLVRSATCGSAEDETDLSRVTFDIERFRNLSNGYIDGAGSLLGPLEHGLLPLAGPLLTLENAVRFLTDHLLGDIYFKTTRPGHNLDRCRAQLRLFDEMWKARAATERIVASAGVRDQSRVS